MGTLIEPFKGPLKGPLRVYYLGTWTLREWPPTDKALDAGDTTLQGALKFASESARSV